MKLSATTLTASLLVSVIAVLLAIPMMLQWERPPMDSTQLGFRGLGMEQITNPRIAETLKALNTLPVPDDPVENDGVLDKNDTENYKNVQVLGDLEDQDLALIVDLERVQNRRQLAVELHVDDGADDLLDPADGVARHGGTCSSDEICDALRRLLHRR